MKLEVNEIDLFTFARNLREVTIQATGLSIIHLEADYKPSQAGLPI